MGTVAKEVEMGTVVKEVEMGTVVKEVDEQCLRIDPKWEL
jgi:hypothetical protein